MTNDERLEIIRARRTSKSPRYTLDQIGQEVNLTRERVRQICEKNGIVQPPRVWEPSLCGVCGDPYESVHGRRVTPEEGFREHLARTGHHPRGTRRVRPWVPNERQQRIIDLRSQTPRPTCAAIAREASTTVSVVNQVLKRAGMAGAYNAERDAQIISEWEN